MSHAFLYSKENRPYKQRRRQQSEQGPTYLHKLKLKMFKVQSKSKTSKASSNLRNPKNILRKIHEKHQTNAKTWSGMNIVYPIFPFRPVAARADSFEVAGLPAARACGPVPAQGPSWEQLRRWGFKHLQRVCLWTPKWEKRKMKMLQYQSNFLRKLTLEGVEESSWCTTTQRDKKKKNVSVPSVDICWHISWFPWKGLTPFLLPASVFSSPGSSPGSHQLKILQCLSPSYLRKIMKNEPASQPFTFTTSMPQPPPAAVCARPRRRSARERAPRVGERRVWTAATVEA